MLSFYKHRKVQDFKNPERVTLKTKTKRKNSGGGNTLKNRSVSVAFEKIHLCGPLLKKKKSGKDLKKI